MVGVSYKRKYYTQKARVKGNGKRRYEDKKEWKREDVSSGYQGLLEKEKDDEQLERVQTETHVPVPRKPNPFETKTTPFKCI